MDKWNESWPAWRKALYHDYHGDWVRAHDLIDHLNDHRSARIHAYLHRVEGDQWNAKYWYNRAGVNVYRGSLQEEWKDLWEERA